MSKETTDIIWKCFDCNSTKVIAHGTMIWVAEDQDWKSWERDYHSCESCDSDNVGPEE